MVYKKVNFQGWYDLDAIIWMVEVYKRRKILLDPMIHPHEDGRKTPYQAG